MSDDSSDFCWNAALSASVSHELPCLGSCQIVQHLTAAAAMVSIRIQDSQASRAHLLLCASALVRIEQGQELQQSEGSQKADPLRRMT